FTPGGMREALALLLGRRRQVHGLERARFGVVAPEMVRVHGGRVNHAGDAEPHDAPVISGGAPAARLPAVHPFAARRVAALDKHSPAWLDQVVLGGEEL